MRTKNIVLFTCAIFIIGMILVFSYQNLSYPSLATDSGYDVSYDSGGGSSGDGGGIFDLIFLFIEYPIPTLILVIIFIIIVSIENSKKRKANGNDTSIVANSYKDEETKKLLLEAYQIFYDTQMAWMNFDYNVLKNLVTDELYNNYHTQLETLKLKGQQNIMRDFKLCEANLLSKKEEENQETIIVSMTVSFYDYIIDTNSKKVLRGKDTQKVTMFYHLTFVKSVEKSDVCPNCGAPLEKSNYCDYCKSHIQGLSTNMRMSKKEMIQPEGRGRM